MMIVNSRLSDAAERRQMRMVLVALGMVWVIGIHNVLVRNWATFFDGTPPALFSRAGDVAEAIVFPFVALALGYAVLRHRLPQRTSA
jgi:hypothetical protein